MDTEGMTIGQVIALVIMVIVMIGGICFGGGALHSVYHVWSQRKAGEAQLAHAESNRQIKTLEAKAAEESAKHLANSEIIRAKGVAEANKIIGDSLKGNESYLRYLWIHNLAECKGDIVYIPTECGLPLLEANRNNREKN